MVINVILIISLIINLILLVDHISIRTTIDRLKDDFKNVLFEDTNVEVFVNTNDRHVRSLARELNKVKAEIRSAYLKFTDGDREVKNTITNIAHDIRTPLTAILGYVDMLEKEEKSLSEEGKKQLAIIKERLAAMRKLTNELFQYSVSVSFDFLEDMVDMSLNAAIEDAVAGFYTEFVRAGIEPEIEICEEQVIRCLNKQAVARIFNNILSNVIKYSEGDCKIILQEDGHMEISNHSSTIDNVVVNHLFDRFYTVKSGENSTGIGLSIAKILTEEMGGRIEAYVKNEELYLALDF